MPSGLKRHQDLGHLHFITFSCYHRLPLLKTAHARRIFEETLEQVRQWYGLYVSGYVVMPEHVHLLVSEPERSTLAVAIQMLKQITAKKLLPALSLSGSSLAGQKIDDKACPERARGNGAPRQFWQVRYYDFNLRSEEKRIEKLKYMHRNPVRRGLVAKPADWEWSSFVHYATGAEGVVEIESEWTGRKRERMGNPLRLKMRSVESHPVVQKMDDKDGAPS